MHLHHQLTTCLKSAQQSADGEHHLHPSSSKTSTDLTSSFTSDIVTLKVGESKSDTFTIHADVFKKHSPFFEAALDKKWKEGQSLQIDLPEDEPDIVEAYLCWLHDGNFEARKSPGDDDLTFVHFAKLYVLGEKIQDNAFCNSVMDAMTKTSDLPAWSFRLPSANAVSILYSGTPEDSPARSYFANSFVSRCRLSKEVAQRYCKEFLEDVVADLANRATIGAYEAQYPRRQTWYKLV